MPKYSFKNKLFFQYGGGSQVYPNHHATQPIVLAVTKCVGRTTHNLGHTMHHVEPAINYIDK